MDWRWQQHHFRAMNTGVGVWWYSDGAHTPAEVEALFRTYEHSLSRFGDSTELVQLNRCEQPVCTVSERLYAALETALWAAEFTHGIYDPTLLDALEQAGYDRSFETIATRGPLQWRAPMDSPAQGAPNAGGQPRQAWRQIQLIPERSAVRRPPGLHIDLGGMGKGWTVDRAADLLHGQGPYLVNAGGDLYAAGKPDGAGGWSTYIEHPWLPKHWIAHVRLEDVGLATSTVSKRRWRRDGEVQHHLIDPRSGKPAQTDVSSVSVIARRTVIADVLAKVALLLGAEEGLAWLAGLEGAAGLIYREDSKVLYTSSFERMLLEVDEQGRAP